jgi:hypothetical protein
MYNFVTEGNTSDSDCVSRKFVAFVNSFLYAFKKQLQKRLLASSCLSVLFLTQNRTTSTERTFLKFQILWFCRFHSLLIKQVSNILILTCTQIYCKWFIYLHMLTSNMFRPFMIIAREVQNNIYTDFVLHHQLYIF